jgi:predicted alpha/beta-fold hydrolase
MTDHLVCKYGGYPSLGEYLHGYAIVDDALASLVHPTRIISSADDPIIPASDLSRIAQPHALSITCTTLGGHCGFYDGQGELTWIEREVLATLSRRQQ